MFFGCHRVIPLVLLRWRLIPYENLFAMHHASPSPLLLYSVHDVVWEELREKWEGLFKNETQVCNNLRPPDLKHR